MSNTKSLRKIFFILKKKKVSYQIAVYSECFKKTDIKYVEIMSFVTITNEKCMSI